VLASFGSIFLFLDVSGWRTVEETTNIWVRAIGTIVACLALLSVAVRAAGSITGERERQTLDGLLTTQLSIDAIFFSKWLASILSVRWTWLWLGLIAAIGVVTGGVHPLALPLLLSAWLVYAAFLAGLGMWFTAASRTTQRATLWMLGTVFVLGGGHWVIWMCCSPFLVIGFVSSFFAEAIDDLARFQLFALTPPATLVCLAFQGDDLRHIDDTTTRLIPVFIMLGVFLYSVGGLVLYGLGRERFRRMTRRRREGSPLERCPEEPLPVLAADENAAADVTPPVHSTPEQEGSQAAG